MRRRSDGARLPATIPDIWGQRKILATQPSKSCRVYTWWVSVFVLDLGGGGWWFDTLYSIQGGSLMRSTKSNSNSLSYKLNRLNPTTLKQISWWSRSHSSPKVWLPYLCGRVSQSTFNNMKPIDLLLCTSVFTSQQKLRPCVTHDNRERTGGQFTLKEKWLAQWTVQHFVRVL